MNRNTPRLPYDKQPTRRIETADLMQALSVIVSAGVIWLALYYTR
jgi:hypothetical protein